MSTDTAYIVSRCMETLDTARKFAAFVDGRVLGPLPDDTRWCLKDLARGLQEDIDKLMDDLGYVKATATVPSPQGGESGQ